MLRFLNVSQDDSGRTRAMVNLLEFLYAGTAASIAVALYQLWRRRRGAAKSWGIAAAVGTAGCAALALYLGGP